MELISSRQTFFYKKIYPPLWYFILASLAGRFFFSDLSMETKILIGLVCIGFSVLGEFIFWKTVRGVVDASYRDGDELVVVNHNKEQRFPISEIERVRYNIMTNPASVTLYFKARAVDFFPRRIKFLAPTTYIPFKKSPVILHLIQDIDRARASSEVL